MTTLKSRAWEYTLIILALTRPRWEDCKDRAQLHKDNLSLKNNNKKENKTNNKFEIAYLLNLLIFFSSFLLSRAESHTVIQGLALNSPCGWGWLWTSDPSASISQPLGLQMCPPIPGLCGAKDRIQDFGIWAKNCTAGLNSLPHVCDWTVPRASSWHISYH